MFASFQLAVFADVEFVLQDEFEELGVVESAGGGLLETDFQSG